MLEELPLGGGEDLAISSISLPVISFGADLALRAGLLNGDLQNQGIILGSFDLMIGVTALEMGYGVGTRNVRHFRMISGLRVVEI